MNKIYVFSLVLLFSCSAALARTPITQHYTLELLAETYPIEYVGEIGEVNNLEGKSDNFFVIHHDPKSRHTPQLGVKMGTPRDLHNVHVSHVKKLRDGGTTTIETTRGCFRFPSPYCEDPQPTFNNKPIFAQRFER